MRGYGDTLTVGERIAWYRRRRGMSQEVLAGMVGRTADWLGKVENGRVPLDRLSVIRNFADALDVTLGDLLGEPTLLEASEDGEASRVNAVREALLNYRQLYPFAPAPTVEPEPVGALLRHVSSVWDAYQVSRYGYVATRIPELLAVITTATQAYDGAERERAFGLLGLSYQVTAVFLTKLGEADLAWIAAERGLTAAQRSGDMNIIGSTFRSVVHTLLSAGRFIEAAQLTSDAAAHLQSNLSDSGPEYLSVYGTLLLAGSVAAARAEDRSLTQEFLRQADEAARRIGRDGNHLWTAFGPTNVSMHRVTAAMDLGDVEYAIDLGPRIDARSMPIERRARHALEIARALSARNRIDEALATVLEAEQSAPEQIRHHAISRQLVQTWIRRGRGKPSFQLSALAQRVRVAS